MRSEEVLYAVLHQEIRWHVPGKHALSGTKTGIEETIEDMDRLAEFKFSAEGIVLGYSDEHIIDCHRIWNNHGNCPAISCLSCILWKLGEGKIREVFPFSQDQHQVDDFFNSQLEL